MTTFAFENRITNLQNENTELKESLLSSRGLYEELSHDNNFNKAKSTELKELLELKDMGQVMDKLMDKTMESAELALKLDSLTTELHNANMCVQNLGQEREGHKKMLLELSDVVRTLQSVNIDYKVTDHSESNLPAQDVPLKNVKKKVEAIMNDRRQILLRNQQLEAEVQRKDEKIAALEAQFHLLNSMNISRGSTDEVDHFALKSTKSPQPRDISRTPTQESSKSRENQITRTPSMDGPVEHSTNRGRVHRPWQDEVSISSSFRGTSNNPTDDEDGRYFIKKTQSDVSCISGATNPASEASCLSSIHVNKVNTFDESEEVERLKAKLADSNEKYATFKKVCQGAFAKMRVVEEELQQAKTDLLAASAKRDEYRGNLRDVISQYKQLSDEYDGAMEYVNQHKGETMEILSEDGIVADNLGEMTKAYIRVKKKSTKLEEQVSAAEREAATAEQKKTTGDRKLRDAIAKHRKLEQEMDELKLEIVEAEDKARLAKKEAQRQKEEAKHTRRRLTTFLRKVDRPETDPDALLDNITDLEATKQQALDEIPWSNDILHRMLLIEATVTGKAWQERNLFETDKKQLMNENEELKSFCEEMLNEIGSKTHDQ